MCGIDTPQRRGQIFDYYVGLLFAQIDGATVAMKENPVSGEVDVLANCVEASSQIRSLIGQHTIVENKWEATRTSLSETRTFHSKCADFIRGAVCHMAFLVSMKGLSKDARDWLDHHSTPCIKVIEREDIIDMAESNNVEEYLLTNFS